MTQACWAAIEPRDYARQIDPLGLIKSFMLAFVLGLPGLRAVAWRGADLLCGCNHSALSHAVRRLTAVRMVQALLDGLASRHTPGRGDLVAIDSMGLTLPSTVRHGCARISRMAVGGAMLWAFVLNAARGVNPVRILKVIEGAWSDAPLMAEVELAADGPIYLMDRGFYAIDLVARWIRRRVRFIVRAKRTKIRYDVEWTMGLARHIGPLRVTEDAIVTLGREDRKVRPRVRLVRATLPTGEELILISGLLGESAEFLLQSYRQRWQIERFHYYLKETLGLAHLYSFQQNGLAFLAHVAVLLCVLLLLAGDADGRKALTVDRLRAILKALRRACGLWGLWRRNTVRKGQTRHLKMKKNH
jgi:hypothetical protein